MTYRGLVTKAQVDASHAAAPVAISNPRKSVTVYTGNEGEEKASKTYNYNYDGDKVKTVTEFSYPTAAL